MIDVTQSKIHQFDHFRKRRPCQNRIRIQSLFQKMFLWLKCHFQWYGQPGFITGYILKYAFGMFWFMAVSFSLYSASVYVMMALCRLWCDYIGSSKMILCTFVTLHTYCNLWSKFLKILEILLKLVIIYTWCSFWVPLNSMYLYVTMNIPGKDISKWLSQVLMLWSAFKQF